MLRRSFKLCLLVLQVVWMVAILPGHVRGMIVIGDGCATGNGAADVTPSCCETRSKPSKPGDAPSPERQSRCAVCYQAHGYTVPPVYDFDLAPSGFCELCRLIEPTKRHLLLCRPTYFANGPPALTLLA